MKKIINQVYWKLSQAIVLLLLATYNYTALAEPIEIESAPGNVTFSHKIHSGSGCLECHHEAASVNRIAPCRQCHLKQSAGKMASKHVFHNNCIDCHARLKQQKKPTGPVKLCSQCHISSDAGSSSTQKAPD